MGPPVFGSLPERCGLGAVPGAVRGDLALAGAGTLLHMGEACVSVQESVDPWVSVVITT